MGTRNTLWIMAALAATAPGQELRWGIPRGGAVEYSRRWTARSDAAESVGAARRLEPQGAVPERYLSRLVTAPVLCQGELDARRQRLQDPPRDLRDVIRAVALDLSIRGSGSWSFGRIVPFGDLSVSGRVTAGDSSGDAGTDAGTDVAREELRLSVASRAVSALPGESRECRSEHVLPLCTHPARGDLLVRRRVDHGRGLVTEFVAELDLLVEERDEDSRARRYRRILLCDEWRLVAVRDGQDAWFRGRVAEVVRDGARWVRATVDGMTQSFLQDGSEDDRSFGSGRVALAALTLLHAGTPRDDPVIEQAFALLRRRRLVDTYSLSTALMAMAQRYAPPGERELVRTGQLARRPVRALEDRDRKAAEKWLQRLLGNLDERVDRDEIARFTYAGGSWADNSLTQYALLGLDAAELCGLPVPARLWPAAAAHFHETQAPDCGRSLELVLASPEEVTAAGGGPPEVRARRTRTRGFAYKHAGEPPYGGMTAAGIAGLVLARAGCLRHDAATPAQLRAIDGAIDQAFAWLGAEFSVRSNPGFVGKADRHWYYWLYGLERACELAGVALVQDRDWYFEGAMQLFAQQQSNGSFRADRAGTLQLDSTCFAILFLEKSTMAAVTGR